MAFLSEFDIEVKHIKGKENKVVDALSRRTHEVYKITMSQPEGDLLSRIKIASIHDAEYRNILNKLWKYKVNLNGTEFKVDQKGLIWFKRIIYMPNIADFKFIVLNELHKPPYAGHPGYQKTITTLRKQFFWPNLKSDLVDYLSKCLECQQVKAEHQHPTGLLQPLPIPEWKWEVISLDFITGFPVTQKQHYSNMVVVYKLRKSAHFIPMKSTYKAVNVAEIFLKEIFRLHEVPKH